MTQTTSGLRWSCKDPDALPGIAAKLLAEAGTERVFALYGNMGAGKTTFIKALCHELGVNEIVTSPTFNIVNEYVTGTGVVIYHFDFYRIKSESEAFDLGFENYLYSGNYCFIEWPEKIAPLLPEHHAAIAITVTGEERVITLTV
jgi:tRNA threonylcarbamoyladenosine biosynthesis protein TsaE